MPETPTDPAARNDTRTRPERTHQERGARLDQPVNDQRGTLSPRAAGAAQTRGAQPSGRRPGMSDLSARVSPSAADLEAQLEALGDWRAILDDELAEMAATTKRIGRLARGHRNA